MSHTLDTRLTALERKRAEREPIRLRLVFGDELTPEDLAEPDKLIVLKWPEDEDDAHSARQGHRKPVGAFSDVGVPVWMV